MLIWTELIDLRMNVMKKVILFYIKIDDPTFLRYNYLDEGIVMEH